MQVKSTASEVTVKPQTVFIDDALTVPPVTTKTITAFVDHPPEWNTTRTGTPLQEFMEIASSLSSQLMSTIIDKKLAVRVNKPTGLHYMIRKKTHIADFLVVTPEQLKFIKPVDMAILSMIPGRDPDVTTHLNKLPRTNKPEQLNNTFWFTKQKNSGKTENHTPIQTVILRELKDKKDKEKMKPIGNAESRRKFLKRFD